MLQSRITQTPDNKNLLQTTKFTFTVPNMPFTTYFCQSVLIPSVSTSIVRQPAMGFSDIKRHGDTLEWENLVITYYVDEELRSWHEGYKWLAAITAPLKFPEYGANSGHDLYRDCVLTIYNNSNIPDMRFKFYNCSPVSLGSIQFDTQGDADVIPVVDLTLDYDYYEFDRIR